MKNLCCINILSLATALLSIFFLLPCVAQAQVHMVPMPNRHLLPTYDIRVIFQDREGYMWYGTKSNGLCRDDGYGVAVFRSDYMHPEVDIDNNITAICDDGHRRLWIGTKRGLYVLDKKDYRFYPTGDRELQSWTYDDVVTGKGDTVLAYANGHILAYNAKGVCVSRQKTTQRLASPDKARLKDRLGHVWQLGAMPYPMVTMHHVLNLREVRFTDLHLNRNLSADGILLPPSCRVRSVVCDSKGNKWLATSDGLWVLWADSKDNVAKQLGPNFGVIKTLDITSDGTVFLGTEHQGLLKYSNDRVTLMDSTVRRVEMLCLDADRLWMTTADGRLLLYSMMNNKLYDQTSVCGLTGDAIVSMVASQGKVWVLSNQNLVVYSSEKSLVRHIRPNDIDSETFQFYRLYTDIDGEVYLHTDKGVYLARLILGTEEYEMSAQVRLSCFRVSGGIRFDVAENGVDGQGIRLAPDERSVQLFFSTFDHLNAQHVRFAYRRQGEDEWQYQGKGHNDFFLTNLSRGEHVIEVMATNGNGQWSDQVLMLTIHCEPHWWETGWAFAVYALVFLTVVGAFFYRHGKR